MPAALSPYFDINDHFTAPKVGTPDSENEDYYGWAADRIVLSDGATDKNGFQHDGHSGGWHASRLVVATCLKTDAYGPGLVTAATKALRQQYEEINPEGLGDSAKRYGATLLDARLAFDEQNSRWEVIITQVGDSGFRLCLRNGSQLIQTNKKVVDDINAARRAQYILSHPNEPIEQGRAYIMPELQTQHRLQNRSVIKDGEEYGYGVIDGTPVPEQFIKLTKVAAHTILSLELFSDGYDILPRKPKVEAYESAWNRQKEVDPHAIGTAGYPPATKPHDDRSIIIARLGC